MKFFIDTANLDQIKEAQDLGILDGVTTNPSLMANEGISGHENIINHYLKICDIVDGDVSAEVISTDFKGIIKEGEFLASLNKQIVVKVPMISEGIKAIKYFTDKKIKTNCTLVFSSGQAIIAAKAGATYLSPFIGRLDDAINSGGLKIQPLEIEQYFSREGLEVYVSSIPHEEFGEAVVLVTQSRMSEEILEQILKDLPKNKRPKFQLNVQQYPQVSNGKIDRNSIRSLVKESQHLLSRL